MIEGFKKIISITGDEQIANEIASFPKEVQYEIYQLMKELMIDELRFVVELEKYRRFSNLRVLP